MMFGHPNQHGHMMSGVQKALKSSKTPAHLRPHLEARMKMFTGAKAQNSPKPIKPGPGGPAAQSQISAPPQPFQSSKNALNLPAAKGPLKGVGTGKSKNAANIKGRSKFYGG